MKHIVIDGGVPESVMRQLYDDAKQFKWVYNRSTYGESTNHVVSDQLYDVGQLVYLVIGKDNKDEKYFEQWLQPIVDAVQPHIRPIRKIDRAKFNLLWHAPDVNNRTNIPHIDTHDISNRKDDKWSLVYYVNQSDGDLVLFYQDEKVRISPRRGRIVLFPANLRHAGTNPANAFERMAINIVMETE